MITLGIAYFSKRAPYIHGLKTVDIRRNVTPALTQAKPARRHNDSANVECVYCI